MHSGIDLSMEDDAIVLRARENVDDFAPLYDRYALPLYRWMCRETGDAELAADLTAQVFVQALQSLHQYDPRLGASFRAWLFAIARNLLRDSWRRYKPGKLPDEMIDQRPGPEELALHRTLMDEVRAALESLPERQRETIELRLSGLSHREIAEIQGTSENAVRMAQSRAMKVLRVLLHQGVKT